MVIQATLAAQEEEHRRKRGKKKKDFLEKQNQPTFTGVIKGLFGYSQQVKYPKGSYHRYMEKNQIPDEMRECPICLTDFDHLD